MRFSRFSTIEMSKPILRTSIRQIGGPRLRCLGLRPSCAVSPWRICRSQIRSDHADQSSNYSSAAPSSSSTAPSIPTFPQVVFSGIQPTGIPHLGNYLGALREWVRLQDSPTTAPDAKLIFSIVDLHALTVPQDRDTLRRWRWESLATLAAIGLDVKRCVLFFQSEVRYVKNSVYASESCWLTEYWCLRNRSRNILSSCGY